MGAVKKESRYRKEKRENGPSEGYVVYVCNKRGSGRGNHFLGRGAIGDGNELFQVRTCRR